MNEKNIFEKTLFQLVSIFIGLGTRLNYNFKMPTKTTVTAAWLFQDWVLFQRLNNWTNCLTCSFNTCLNQSNTVLQHKAHNIYIYVRVEKLIFRIFIERLCQMLISKLKKKENKFKILFFMLMCYVYNPDDLPDG